MKKELTSVKLVLASALVTALSVTVISCGSGSEPFAVSKEGMALVTANYDEYGDKSFEKREIVKSVTKSGKDKTITSITQFADGGGGEIKTVESVTNVINGDVEFDVGGMFANITGMAVTSAGKMRVPSKMRPGDVFGDIKIDMGVLKLSITNRQLAAIESITVPAGTFKNAYKVTYKMGPDGEMLTKTDWYVRGIGEVKSIAIDGDGNPMFSSELMKMGKSDGKLTVDVTPKDAGKVSTDPNQAVYPAGTSVTLTAEAAPGYRFKEWASEASGVTKRTSVAAVGDVKVTAVFEKFDDLDMVSVEGGTFTMGCTDEQGDDCGSNEKPAHSVTVGNFNIGKFEVTQRLWTRIMGNNPSNFKGDDLPVENVSWNDIQEFIKKLNAQTGKQYRLPTEAEWEYAVRGGNRSKGYKHSGSNNIEKVAWSYENAGDEALDGSTWNKNKLRSNNNRTHPIGTKSPNELGIYDMSGNVWEWAIDWFGNYATGAQTNPQGPSSGTYRINRGGSWAHAARGCRISSRAGDNPDFRYSYLGFRLALSSAAATGNASVTAESDMSGDVAKAPAENGTLTDENSVPNSIKAIRTGLQTNGKTRLVIETTGKPSYSLAYSERQLQITLKGGTLDGAMKPNIGAQTLATGITPSQNGDDVVISVSLTSSINEIPAEQIMVLEPSEDNKNFRIVLDFGMK